MKVCQVSHCNEIHEARGYCKKHYRSLVRHGDPTRVDVNRKLREEADKFRRSKESSRMSRNGFCYVENCDGPIKSKGLCEKHYARKRRTGKLTVKFERLSIRSCIAFDCKRDHKANGYCDYHSKLFRENGSPYRPRIIKKCGVANCNSDHMAKGMCAKHYKRWNRVLEDNGLQNKEVNSNDDQE